MTFRIDEDITFRKLEILLAFMETGNLARAAERLDISTVSVHRALHSLETGMRCALFRHEGRNLHPTDAAHALAEDGARGAAHHVRRHPLDARGGRLFGRPDPHRFALFADQPHGADHRDGDEGAQARTADWNWCSAPTPTCCSGCATARSTRR